MIVAIIKACAQILIALIAIIPTIIAKQRQTQETIHQTAKETGEQVKQLQSTLDEHIRQDGEENARNQRYRILRFYDEICEGRNHSESHFEDILEDIDKYEAYCAAHPDFHNNRGHVAMKCIKETYERIKNNGGFLAQKED